jgi:hypothetical protein
VAEAHGIFEGGGPNGDDWLGAFTFVMHFGIVGPDEIADPTLQILCKGNLDIARSYDPRIEPIRSRHKLLLKKLFQPELSAPDNLDKRGTKLAQQSGRKKMVERRPGEAVFPEMLCKRLGETSGISGLHGKPEHRGASLIRPYPYLQLVSPALVLQRDRSRGSRCTVKPKIRAVASPFSPKGLREAT